MATYVLVPGAGGGVWFWHRLIPELRALGHEAIPVDLPTGDETAGLKEYADAVVDAVDGRPGTIVVAQSMGAFSAPLACARAPIGLLVLLNPMIPRPGEAADDWWAATGMVAARAEQAVREGRTPREDVDLLVDFFHDVPPDVTAEAVAAGSLPQANRPFGEPWPAAAWPEVPTRVLQGRDDRFFPLDFQRRVARERLGVEVDETPGGHLSALSYPAELAGHLDRYRSELGL
ncbi:alpha/beta fold hydrolase [Microbispora corallina]|uniref:Alpha/beta hydrolase n=1 Tax=Microbispora corallina TaxID=83302 RepID=A0ABQ4G675_9ACTN|nr:alpha/beta hydrolase [Microbispora corallina]GIH42534.1 alpha/beta hydrolase [Microbispora corallina]